MQGIPDTHRIAIEELKARLEVTVHVRLDEFTNVWLLLDVSRECVVIDDLGFDGGSRELGECTQCAVNGYVARCNELASPVTKLFGWSQPQEVVRRLLVVALSEM